MKTIPLSHTFQFRFTSELDGQTYNGIFTVKRPTIGMHNQFRLKAISYCDGRYYDHGSPGSGVDIQTWMNAIVISRLESCFTDVQATWFDSKRLWDSHDPSLLEKLWEEVVAFDTTIFRGIPAGHKAGSSAEHREANVGSGSAAVVVTEVPSAHSI